MLRLFRRLKKHAPSDGVHAPEQKAPDSGRGRIKSFALCAFAVGVCSAAVAIGSLTSVVAQGAPPVYAARSGMPSMRLVQQAELVTPAVALSHYGSVASPAAPARGPRIVALSRALGGDPDRIFEYVRNTIEFEPHFGLQKGGEGAWLDRSGGAFDQAQLMVELLREAGLPARYVLGNVSLGTEASSILKVDDARQACLLLAAGGTPAVVNGVTSCSSLSGGVTSVSMLHVWVETQIAGVWYAYDPALKRNVRESGVDLWSFANTSASSLGASLRGGVAPSATTIPSTAVSSVSTTMNGVASTVLSNFRQNHAGEGVREALGLWDIEPEQAQRVTALPNATVTARWAGDVPTPYRAKVTITAPGFNHTFDLPSIYGHRVQAQMAEFYGRNTAFSPPQYGGVPPALISANHFRVAIRKCQGLPTPASVDACEAANIVKGSPTSATAWDRSFTIAIDHPYAALGGAYADETITKYSELGSRAELILNIGTVRPHRYERHRQRQDAFLKRNYVTVGDQCVFVDNTANGNYEYGWECEDGPDPAYHSLDGVSATMEEQFAVGEHAQLDLISQKDHLANAWATQQSAMLRLVEPASQTRLLTHHSIGVVVTRKPSTSTSQSSHATFIDVESAIAVAPSSSGMSPHIVLAAVSALSSEAEAEAFLAMATRGSAPAPDMATNVAGVWSGVRTLGAGGTTFYRLNPGSSAQSLPSTVPAAIKTQADQYLSTGHSVVVASNGQGMLALRADGSEAAWLVSADTGSATGLKKGGVGVFSFLGRRGEADDSKSKVGDPAGMVDLRTGQAMFSEPPDVVVGQGEFPHTLFFQRTYSSSGFGGSRALGIGWTHNFASSLTGDYSSLHRWDSNHLNSIAAPVAAVLGALAAAESGDIVGATMAGAVGLWAGDQNHPSIVAVVGPSSETFVRQVDGIWESTTSPVGRLQKSGTTWIRTLPDRSTQTFGTIQTVTGGAQGSYSFGTIYALKSWQFPAGAGITLNYTSQVNNDDVLSSVVSNTGARLEYTINQPQRDWDWCNASRGNSADCSNSEWTAGYLTQVKAIGTGGAVVASAQFGRVQTWCDTSFRCTESMGFVTRSDRRRRTYAYADVASFPSGYGGLASDFVLLTSIGEDGLSTPKAEFTWDAAGLLLEPTVISVADAAGRDWQIGSTGDAFAHVTDPLGNTSTRTYSPDGHLVTATDPLGRSQHATFDSRGRVLTDTSAWGDVTSYKYDGRDNVTEVKRSPRADCGTDPYWCQTSIVTATYHATWNKPTSVTLPATGPDAQSAGTWTFAYDAQGRLITQTSPTVANGLGGTGQAISRTLYDSFGRVRWTKDPTGIESRIEYGPSNAGPCMTAQHAADQSSTWRQTTLFVCNAAGDVTSVTDPRGKVTTFTYDSLRRKRTAVGPVSTAINTQWDYDLDGNLTVERRWDSTASAWRATTTTYSQTGQPLTVTNPAGEMARKCYDVLDRPTVSVDPSGRATRTTYNAASQPTLVERWFTASLADPACVLTQARPSHLNTNRWRELEYNSAGMPSAEIDGNGNRTTMDYDGLGRPMRTTFADGKFIQTVHNERDQVVITVKRSGDVHQAFYDPLGRIDRVWEHAPAAAYPVGRITRTSYDYAGRPTLTDVSTQTTTTWNNALLRDIRTYGYDGAGRVQYDRITPNNGAMGSTQLVMTYGYDKSNNRVSIKWPDAYQANYTFDDANRASRVEFGPVGNTAQYHADIAVDSLSRRTGLNRSNGVNTSYAYATDSDLTQINHAWAPSAGQAAAIFDFQRDAAGRLTSLAISRSDLEWAPSLAYAQTYGVPTNLNQTTSRSGVSLVWDDNGNLDSYGTTGDPNYRDYVWTYGNRLAEVHGPGTDTYYAYDSTDRRTSVIEDGVMTRTLWSGSDEVAEYDTGGVLKRRFIPDGSGAMDARLATVNANNTLHWYHTDHLGSVIATSNAAGQPAGFTNYSPHGEFGTGAGGVALAAPPTGSPFGYTGRQWDAKAGLYQYRARYYDPRLGVFLSMDPIGTKDDPNLYMYVGGDPVNKTDPTGETARVRKNERTGIITVIVPVTITGNVSFEDVSAAVSSISQYVTDDNGRVWEVRFYAVEGTFRRADNGRRYTNEVRTSTWYRPEEGNATDGYRSGGNQIMVVSERSKYKTIAHEVGGHGAGIADLHRNGSPDVSRPDNLMNNMGYTTGDLELEWFQIEQMFDPRNGNDIRAGPEQ
jgi:RHS repeat-associated protein